MKNEQYKAPVWLPIWAQYVDSARLFFRVNENEKRVAEFKSIVKNLNFQPNDELLSSGLEYFRNAYQTRSFPYPGDFVYYEMLKDAMKKGYSQEKAFAIAKYIIDREMDFLDVSKALGEPYTENWNDY